MTSRPCSFYPAHHITMGEGGAVLTDKPMLQDLIESVSATGAATAGASPARTTPAASASTGNSANLPCGYDHKYTYSHIGYNLKATDMQAAVGVAQLDEAAGVRRSAASGTSRICTKGLQPLRGVLDSAGSHAEHASRAGSASRWPCGRMRRSRAIN